MEQPYVKYGVGTEAYPSVREKLGCFLIALTGIQPRRQS